MAVRRTLVAGTALLLVATGCGGGGKIGAEEYVASVCTEVGGWVEEVQARSDRLGKDVEIGRASCRERVFRVV